MSALKCRECGRRRETRVAQRFGGGSYNRAGRWSRASICEECARAGIELVDEAIAEGRTPGTTVWRWSVASLRRVWDLPEAPPAPSRGYITAPAGWCLHWEGIDAEYLALVVGIPLVEASILAEPHLVRGTQ